ncbi:MAG: TfoX/Sxy family protein [candidate division WOR-3 bacterium]|jgi:TfoX/Sxy family transcriptional regulator of competence genes
MKWQKPSEELVTLLKKKLENTKCESRKVFGCPSYFINNNMFIGVFQKNIFIRLSPEDAKETLEKHPKVRHFEPRTGMVMKEYLTLPETIYQRKDVFSRLLEKSLEYVRSLPPKKKR